MLAHAVTREGLAPPHPPDAAGRCTNCGSTQRVVDPGNSELHCADCGLVFDPGLVVDDVSPREPGQPTDGGRGIGPFVAPGTPRHHLGSTLGGRRDGRGRTLDAAHRNYYGHLKWLMDREVSRRSETSLERSPAREVLARMAATLSLPPVVATESERLFQEGSLRGAFRGRSLSSSCGAALYAACRQFGLPRTLGEVSKGLALKRSEVGRAFKALARTLGSPPPSVNLHAYLQRYAEELALTPQVRSTVESMLREVHEHPEVSGLSPHGVVAALIFLASEQHGDPRPRTRVARVGSVTEVTLRSTSRLLTRLLAETPSKGTP